MRLQQAFAAFGCGDRALIALATQSGCYISAELERRIRRDERCRVIALLGQIEAVAISREPSRRRVALRAFAGADALEAEVRRDERALIVRELRREARLIGAAGLDGSPLELAAAELERKPI
jgi:hypothetical protein